MNLNQDTLKEPAPAVRDRIKLPFHFDAEKMIKDLEALSLPEFIYYNVVTLRGPAHLVDSSLPIPPPAEDYADGSWTDWLDTRELKAMPYIKEIVDFFASNTTVNLVRLLRLQAGNIVKEHTDPTLGLEIEKSMVRLTIPIISPKEVKFYLNDSVVDMKAGECWYLRLTDKHSIINESTTDRINLTIDVIPNKWLKDTIVKSIS